VSIERLYRPRPRRRPRPRKRIFRPAFGTTDGFHLREHSGLITIGPPYVTFFEDEDDMGHPR